MPVNSVTPPSGIFNTLQILGANNALGWADQIMAAATGTGNANNVLEALNEKLEVSGVLATGTTVPAHSSTSALFFYKTDDDALYIKGTSSYSELSDSAGFAANVILNIGRTTPTWNAVHSSTSPIIFFNTATAELWFKTGSDYRQFVGQAADMGFEAESGDTVLAGQDNVEDALKALSRYVRNLPSSGGSSTDDQTASEVNTDTSNFNNNLNSADTTVQLALDKIDNIQILGTDDQVASEVNTTTTNFDQNLSSADSTVQLALDTLDDLDVPPYYDQEWTHQDDLMQGVGSYYTQAFTIPTRLTNFRDRYQQPLYIVADSNVVLQSTVGSPQSVSFVFEILDAAGNRLRDPIESDIITLTHGVDLNPVRRRIRIQAVLPTGFEMGEVAFNGGRLNTRVTAVTGTPASGVDFQRVQVHADPSAIDPSDFDGNLAETDNTVQKIAQKFDDYVPSGADVTIDATGFDGNLATTDDDAQKVAQKVDDLVLGTTQNASAVPIVLTPTNPFLPPVEEDHGGIRGLTGLTGIEDNPDDVRAALQVVDRRLIDAYDPFRYKQGLNRFVLRAGRFSDSFTVNTATQVFTDAIDIPAELRDLSTDLDINVRVRVQSIGSGWVGNISLWNEGRTAQITGGDPEAVNTTTNSDGTYVTFRRTITTANVPDTFRIRFIRTGGTSSAVFDTGQAFVYESLGSGGSGGAGGQAGSYTTAIIWLAGAQIHDRLTQRSESINRTLMSGHRFPDYDRIAFVVDSGPGATQPLMSLEIDRNLFEAFGAAGYLNIQGQYWLMFSRQSDTEFRWRWGANANGLRRVMGIRTN